MIAVIQCANRKRPEAGYLETPEGQRVCFVANPEAAPASSMIYARPDDRYSAAGTWREALLAYNHRQDNPLGLLSAGELYQNPIYHRLSRHVGSENLYILSAGWGLIPASFLTRKFHGGLADVAQAVELA